MAKQQLIASHCPFVIGLTGGIGMGKSTVARMFARLGAHIINADALVHRLMMCDAQVIAEIKHFFPHVFVSGNIDRGLLGKAVFEDEAKLDRLEAILHPRVRAIESQALVHARRLGVRCVVVDIPLLFESQAQERFDAIVVVSAPAFIQRQRVLARTHMTEAKFHAILQRQWPDADKCAQADMVIHTGLGRGYSMRQVKEYATEVTRLCVR